SLDSAFRQARLPDATVHHRRDRPAHTLPGAGKFLPAIIQHHHRKLAMAPGPTMHRCNVDLADSDRGIYETLEIRAAQHPSEPSDYLLTRVLAYCLEYADGIAFSKGLSDPDEPTIAIRDLTGALQVWIEIGAPDAERV